MAHQARTQSGQSVPRAEDVDGGSLTITVNPATTIEELERMVAYETSTCMRRQRLIYQGKQFPLASLPFSSHVMPRQAVVDSSPLLHGYAG
eukprot:5990810-Karenia_brevis.AAC.1